MKQLVSEIKRHYRGEIKFQSEIWKGWNTPDHTNKSSLKLNETTNTDTDMPV